MIRKFIKDVKWLGYNHDKNKHDVILVEVLDDL